MRFTKRINKCIQEKATNKLNNKRLQQILSEQVGFEVYFEEVRRGPEGSRKRVPKGGCAECKGSVYYTVRFGFVEAVKRI